MRLSLLLATYCEKCPIVMMSHSDVVSLTHLAMAPQGGQSPHLMESHQYVLCLTISQKYVINIHGTKSTHFMLALTRMVQKSFVVLGLIVPEDLNRTIVECSDQDLNTVGSADICIVGKIISLQ